MKYMTFGLFIMASRFSKRSHFKEIFSFKCPFDQSDHDYRNFKKRKVKLYCQIRSIHAKVPRVVSGGSKQMLPPNGVPKAKESKKYGKIGFHFVSL